jgi:lysozyme
MDEVLELASELAKPFEGLIMDAYFDPVGYPTQGYGRLLSRQVWGPLGRQPNSIKERQEASQWLKDKYPTIDEHTAEIWLKEDMIRAAKAAIRLCPGAESVQQLAAITDFTFNCGAGNLEMSALRRKVNRYDFDGAADEFLRWVYARGIKLPGLVRRRNAEKQLFLS